MNGRDRPRPPPSGESLRGGEVRNGPGDGPKSSADKFEDEKKRIIRTCYSKKDNDGNCMWIPTPSYALLEISSTPSSEKGACVGPRTLPDVQSDRIALRPIPIARNWCPRTRSADFLSVFSDRVLYHPRPYHRGCGSSFESCPAELTTRK